MRATPITLVAQRCCVMSASGDRSLARPGRADHFVPTAAFSAFLDDVRRGGSSSKIYASATIVRIAELLDEHADLRDRLRRCRGARVVERRRRDAPGDAGSSPLRGDAGLGTRGCCSWSVLIAVTDHAAERCRQRVRGTLDARGEIVARVGEAYAAGRVAPARAAGPSTCATARWCRCCSWRTSRAASSWWSRCRSRARRPPFRAASPPTPWSAGGVSRPGSLGRVLHSRMGFLDKAKKMAEQAQAKLDEAQGESMRAAQAAATRGGRGRVRPARAPDRRAQTEAARGDPAAGIRGGRAPRGGAAGGRRSRRRQPLGAPAPGEPDAAGEDRNRPGHAPPPLSSGDPLAGWTHRRGRSRPECVRDCAPCAPTEAWPASSPAC